MWYLFIIICIITIAIIICQKIDKLYKQVSELSKTLEYQKEELLSARDPIAIILKRIEVVKEEIENIEEEIMRYESNSEQRS